MSNRLYNLNRFDIIWFRIKYKQMYGKKYDADLLRILWQRLQHIVTHTIIITMPCTVIQTTVVTLISN